MRLRHIAVLGSTGSIGRQALDVVRQHPDKFQIDLLTANNSSQRLIEQALR
jgi:1-deoxy-D-xylulose-5-phosphate reductoisomerase